MNKKKNLFLLIGSQLFSVLGTTIMQFAISLYVLDFFQSLWSFSLITALSVIGRVICLPICGVIADRLPKKKVMLFMDMSYLVFIFLYTFVISFNQSFFLFGCLTVVLGMISAFETPVVQSTIPLIVERKKIPQINSVISGIGILGGIFGPMLSGILYQFDQIQRIFIWAGVLFLFAICCELFLSVPLIQREKGIGSLYKIVSEDFKEIITYLSRKTVILQICLLAMLLNLFVSSFIQVMIPYILRIQLQVTDQQFGLMNTSFALGGLLGTVIYGLNGKNFSFISIYYGFLFSSFTFLSLLLPLYWFQKERFAFWMVIGIVSLIMVLFSFVSLQLMVYIQMNIETVFLGRVMAFVMVISSIAMPLGQLIYGGLGQLLTGEATIILIISVSFATLLIALYSRLVVRKM